MNLFIPSDHQFVELSYDNPWGLTFFEFLSHPAVDGAPNHCRINVFMSRDGHYTHIWEGLLEPMIARVRLTDHGVSLPEDCDLDQYHEPLFRGHIETEEQARHILHALRIADRVPQLLRGDERNRLVCELLADQETNTQ